MSSLEQSNELRLKSIYITSGLIAIAAAAFYLMIGCQRMSAGIAVGSALSIASLAAIKTMTASLTESIDTEKLKSKTRRMQFMALGRYIAAGVIIWAAIRYCGADGAGIAAGAALTFLVMLITALIASIISETRLNRRV